LLKSSHC